MTSLIVRPDLDQPRFIRILTFLLKYILGYIKLKVQNFQISVTQNPLVSYPQQLVNTIKILLAKLHFFLLMYKKQNWSSDQKSQFQKSEIFTFLPHTVFIQCLPMIYLGQMVTINLLSIRNLRASVVYWLSCQSSIPCVVGSNPGLDTT